MSEKDLKNDQKVVDLTALHAQIAAGELTKKQAADAVGWSYPRLCVALKRAGLLDSVRTARATAKYDTAQMAAAVHKAVCTPAETRNLAAIARECGLPASQYASFAMRVLHITRSRMKADLTDAQAEHSGAAAGS